MHSKHSFPQQLDHLVFTAPTLKTGMDTIHDLLGVRPVIGGRHPDFGTHNALLDLGNSIYLEVIAPDPEAKTPEWGRFLQEYYHKSPQLATWVLRKEDIEVAANKAMRQGVGIGRVQACSRKRPDGSILSWKLTNPYAMPMGGAIPFLISWGNSPHPSSSIPNGGILVDFKIEHPNSEQLIEQLKYLDNSVEIIQAEEVRMIATIKSSRGIIQLQ